MKKILTCFLLILFTFLTGCINKQELLIIGEDGLFVGDLIIFTHNYDKDLEEVWTSSNEEIALVDAGTVYGISAISLNL